MNPKRNPATNNPIHTASLRRIVLPSTILVNVGELAQRDQSAPLRKAGPWPMAAAVPAATIGWNPGILRMRLQPASLSGDLFEHVGPFLHLCSTVPITQRSKLIYWTTPVTKHPSITAENMVSRALAYTNRPRMPCADWFNRAHAMSTELLAR